MNKNTVLILGGGLAGAYASKLFLLKNFKVILYEEDANFDDIEIREIISNTVQDFYLICGNFDEKILNNIELIITTNDFFNYNLLIEKARNKSIPIISELELGYLLSKGMIAAVAGSSGKTTTILLLEKMLKKNYLDVHTINSKNNPFTKEILSTDDRSVTAIECYAKELENINKFKPDVCAILNFNKDSSKNFTTYEDYIRANINIARNMTKSDCLILNYDDEVLRNLAKRNDLFRCKIVFFSSKKILPEGVFLNDEYIYLKEKGRNIKLCNVNTLKLKGTHNYENIMAAIAMAHYLAVNLNDIVDTIKEFKPIKNCIEYVRTKGGIDFYNDSNATTPNAAIKAILAMNGKTILISGGRDTNYDYSEFSNVVKDRVRHLVLVGENKKIIASKVNFSHFTSIAFAENLEEAIKLANNYANMGDAVLFSPGSMPENETIEERGEKFKLILNSM